MNLFVAGSEKILFIFYSIIYHIWL
jgi:hypothetical protein